MMRVLILIGFLCGASGVLADDALWARIAQGGYVLLIRHAATEAGTGDPSGFRIGDCATQRNLSAAGREEARRLGETFRAHGVPVAEVRSSPWCRRRAKPSSPASPAASWNCSDACRLRPGHRQVPPRHCKQD